MTVKEYFSENWKTWVTHTFIVVFTVACTLSCVLSVTQRRINSRDSEIATLRFELSDARRESERAGNLIGRITEIQRELSAGLESNNEELGGIIKRLESIRDSVSDLERCISGYNDNSSNFDFDSNLSESEK